MKTVIKRIKDPIELSSLKDETICLVYRTNSGRDGGFWSVKEIKNTLTTRRFYLTYINKVMKRPISPTQLPHLMDEEEFEAWMKKYWSIVHLLYSADKRISPLLKNMGDVFVVQSSYNKTVTYMLEHTLYGYQRWLDFFLRRIYSTTNKMFQTRKLGPFSHHQLSLQSIGYKDRNPPVYSMLTNTWYPSKRKAIGISESFLTDEKETPRYLDASARWDIMIERWLQATWFYIKLDVFGIFKLLGFKQHPSIRLPQALKLTERVERMLQLK